MSECSICLESTQQLSVCLPCGHSYCLCCIKTYQLRTKGACCPECRQLIPVHYLESLGQDLSHYFQKDVVYTHWAYRSASKPNKWWLYPEDTNTSLEQLYPNHSQAKVTILGQPYTIDFYSGVQTMDGNPGKVRHIKRIVCKGADIWTQHGVIGIAGIKHVPGK